MTSEMDKAMERLKALGATIETRSAPGASFQEQRPMSIIHEAAKRHGIAHEPKVDDLARAERIGRDAEDELRKHPGYAPARGERKSFQQSSSFGTEGSDR